MLRSSAAVALLSALSTLGVLSCAEPLPPPQPAPAPLATCPPPVAPAPAVTCPAGATWNGTACVAPLVTAPADFASLAEAQIAANSTPGLRHLPARDVPVPTEDVSPSMQAIIGRHYDAGFRLHPKDAAEWKAIVAKVDDGWGRDTSELAAKLHVTLTPTAIAGVPCFVVTPAAIPAKNKNRLLLHVHGGGYLFGGGVASAYEAVLLAAFGGFKVIAVDYRRPPDSPFPAAMDDAIAVWKKAVTMASPKNMAIFGGSTGGGMTLAMVLRARDEHLPLPAAIAPSTPWADLTDTGDSYKANEWLDNSVVTMTGLLDEGAKVYAAGHDRKDPQLSPIYGDFHGLPPAILTTGTRDLFLSNTVRAHRKLRRAGVEAELHVYEGQSHGQYMEDADVPETKEAFVEIASFFDRHLGH